MSIQLKIFIIIGEHKDFSKYKTMPLDKLKAVWHLSGIQYSLFIYGVELVRNDLNR